MGKRKKAVPQKLTEEKKQCLSWNMYDNAAEDSSVSVVSDNDPALLAELAQSAETGTDARQKPAAVSQVSAFVRDNISDVFSLHTENCLFNLPLYRGSLKSDQWSCILAEFHAQFSPAPLFMKLPTNELPNSGNCWLYVSPPGDKDILCFGEKVNKPSKSKQKKIQKNEIMTVSHFWLVDIDVPVECLKSLKGNTVQLLLTKFDSSQMRIEIQVIGTDTILSQLTCPSEAVRMKAKNMSIITMMKHFYKLEAQTYETLSYTKKHDIDELYSVIKHRHLTADRVVSPHVQHPDLLPCLRPYQKLAISWMLEKEKCAFSHRDQYMLHSLYQEVITVDQQILYYNPNSGVLLKGRPMAVQRIPGGILGDEMGLGKTVEVLGCVLLHPREDIQPLDVLPVIEDMPENNECLKKKKMRKKKGTVEDYDSEDSSDTIIYSESDISLQADNVMDNKTAERNNVSGSNHLSESQTCPEAENDHHRNIFTERPKSKRADFECVCGSTDQNEFTPGRRKRRKHAVQCYVCNLWQHAECVNYDVRDPYRGEFKCPHCHVASTPISSGATLIISPSSIAQQWVEEILKHVAKQSLNVFVYTGVHKQGFIQPQLLARQDIVITTYETLRKEIDYVDLPHNNSESGRQLRHPKRFMAIPSPIIAVEWWRICLDEAQMVECTTTKTAEMALRLTAVNRWCVTGTPIQKSIDDLYGLLLFLGVDPYWVQCWWHKLVYDPYCHGVMEPLHDLLTSVLWRTVKDDVVDQINIPDQSEETYWLTFSPVEEHFYRRQLQHNRDCFRTSLNKLTSLTDISIRLSSLDRHTVHQLLYPLLRLRQACCHPQAVRGEFIPIHKSTMTMEELLESLTKKAKLEAEEAHRALVAAINGQAGLHIIKEQYVDAVERYREVLRSVEEHKEMLHTDSLQQLHSMYNLNEVLSAHRENIAPTLRDDKLPEQIRELKDHYIAKAVAYVKSTEESLAQMQIEVKQLQLEFKDGSEWWIEVIEWAVKRDQEDVILLKVRNDLLDNRNPQIDTLVRSCRAASGLQYAMHVQLSNLQTAYKKVTNCMKKLAGKPSQELINQTVICCLRPVAEVLKTCPFCKSEEMFEAYETKLFSFVDKGVETGPSSELGQQVHTRRQGTWADSELEKALKSVLAFAKSYRAKDEIIEFGSTHIKLLDTQKKEYKRLRTHWAGIKEYVGSFDELDMSMTRLRLRLPDEEVPEIHQMYILEQSQLDNHRLKLASDRIVAQGDLRKKLGQLLYLTNLAESQTEQKCGANPEPCPICQQELGKEWSVMQCGHCFCLECVRILVERAAFGRQTFTIKCPVCRQATANGEISYVTTKKDRTEEEGGMKVKGSHSTKVEAVVRCIKQIKRQDPKAKSLVFSTWTDVLSVIATALEENDILYKALYTSGKFQENLSAFKQQEDISVLLLPVHSGANGLNLIEATHVLLVEPILNPAQELQAIGRVHRIGQTRPTVVHRFLIRGTIEQKMHQLVQSMDKHNPLKNSEENSLTIGDLSSLFTQQVEEDNREGVHSTDEVENTGVDEVEHVTSGIELVQGTHVVENTGVDEVEQVTSGIELVLGTHVVENTGVDVVEQVTSDNEVAQGAIELANTDVVELEPMTCIQEVEPVTSGTEVAEPVTSSSMKVDEHVASGIEVVQGVHEVGNEGVNSINKFENTGVEEVDNMAAGTEQGEYEMENKLVDKTDEVVDGVSVDIDVVQRSDREVNIGTEGMNVDKVVHEMDNEGVHGTDEVENIVNETEDACKVVNSEPAQSVPKVVNSEPAQSVHKVVNSEPAQSVHKVVNSEPAQIVPKLVNSEPAQSVHKVVNTVSDTEGGQAGGNLDHTDIDNVV